MRLLFVTPFFEPAWEYGGISRATSGLARALAQAGHDIVVMTTRWHAGHAAAETLDGFAVRRFQSPSWLRRRLFPMAPGLEAEIIEEHRHAPFALAHLAGHRSGLAYATGRTLRKMGVPWVVQPHGTHPHHGSRRWLKWTVDRIFAGRLLRDAAAVVAVSNAEAADLPRPAIVIPNGVSSVGTTAGMAACRKEGLLLFVGNDSSQKRGVVLMDVLSSLPETRLDLAGRFGGRFRAQFDGFGARVRWLGVLGGSDLAAAYQDATLIVHPASGEAFGLAAFEAALHGTAAVVAGGHGCGEWFGQAGGCVVPPGDTEALCGAVRERLRSRDLRAREVAAVAAFVRSRFRWADVARQHAGLYATLLRAG